MEKRLVRVAGAVIDIESVGKKAPSVEANPEPSFLKLDANESTVGPSPAVYEAIESFLHNWPLNWSTPGENRQASVRHLELCLTSSRGYKLFR